jgi:hypothetical protein
MNLMRVCLFFLGSRLIPFSFSKSTTFRAFSQQISAIIELKPITMAQIHTIAVSRDASDKIPQNFGP